MKRIESIQGFEPNFGMSVKFRKGGEKYFNKVFEKNQTAGYEFIKRQMNNKTSDIYVYGSGVKVGINSAKWRVVGSIWSRRNNSKMIEEMFLSRKAGLFRKQAFRAVIREGAPLADSYGVKGRKLAIAEEIANYLSYRNDNKAPSLIDRIKAFFANDI